MEVSQEGSSEIRAAVGRGPHSSEEIVGEAADAMFRRPSQRWSFEGTILISSHFFNLRLSGNVTISLEYTQNL